MAKYQYRISGELAWQSNSGNALLAIENPLGSGKKLVLKSFELTPQTVTTTGTAGTVSAAPGTIFNIARLSPSGGTAVPVAKADTADPNLPAAVTVVKNSTVVLASSVVGRVAVQKCMSATTALERLARQNTTGRLAGVSWCAYQTAANRLPLALAEGESIGVFPVTLGNSLPLRVTATFYTSAGATYVTSYFVLARTELEAVLTIRNGVGSGVTVHIINVALEEVGVYDSPYFQLVPVGAINPDAAADPARAVGVMSMDTLSPAASPWLRAYQDVPIFPLGMPENALADASTGSPKGFNYLKTKDFVGPAYRVVFPEYVPHRVNNTPDGLGFLHARHRAASIVQRGSDIVIREGEAVALVSAAETAAGATAAVGTSGWAAFEFAAQVSVEPKATPTLTLTGLKPNTEVGVYLSGELLAGAEDIDTGTFSWTYDPDDYASVDISVLSLGYQNIRLTNVALGSADLTIPIQQQLDRQYLNP